MNAIKGNKPELPRWQRLFLEGTKPKSLTRPKGSEEDENRSVLIDDQLTLFKEQGQ